MENCLIGKIEGIRVRERQRKQYLDTQYQMSQKMLIDVIRDVILVTSHREDDDVD